MVETNNYDQTREIVSKDAIIEDHALGIQDTITIAVKATSA